jgi:hypothetical protein
MGTAGRGDGAYGSHEAAEGWRRGATTRAQSVGLKRVPLVVALAVGCLAASATGAQQQAGKLWRIGVLMNVYPPDAEPPQALRQGLRDLGYVEGQNLVTQRSSARRSPGRAAHQIRAGHQPQDGQGPRPDHPALCARAGGRGDRVMDWRRSMERRLEARQR